MKERHDGHTPRTVVELLIDTEMDASSRRDAVGRLRARLNPSPDAFLVRALHDWAGNVDVRVDESANHHDRSPCPFPWFSLVVLWNGDALACPQDFFAENGLGNVADTTLDDVWNGEMMMALRRKLADGKGELSPPCSKCRMREMRGVFGLPASSIARVVRQTLQRT
jgi:radical SAM protein with 4Fe4S-binding SPASM domain